MTSPTHDHSGQQNWGHDPVGPDPASQHSPYPGTPWHGVPPYRGAPSADGPQDSPIGYQSHRQQPVQRGGHDVRGQDELSRIRLNYWLSVFFTWIPALVFYLLDKDKASPKLRHFQAQNLNFAILRFMVAAVAGVIDAGLLGVVGIVLFVLHIMAAVKVDEAYRSNAKAPFKFNITMID